MPSVPAGIQASSRQVSNSVEIVSLSPSRTRSLRRTGQAYTSMYGSVFPFTLYWVTWKCPLIEDGLAHCDTRMWLDTIQIFSQWAVSMFTDMERCTQMCGEIENRDVEMRLCDHIHIKKCVCTRVCVCSQSHHPDTWKRWVQLPMGSETKVLFLFPCPFFT